MSSIGKTSNGGTAGNIIAVMNFIGFVAGFIINMHNLYSVIVSFKEANAERTKVKKRKLGF